MDELFALCLVTGIAVFTYGQAMLAWPDLFERCGSVSLGKLDPRAWSRWSGAGMLLMATALLMERMWVAGGGLLVTAAMWLLRPDQESTSPVPPPE